jgi:hypothetical protein
LRSVTELFQQTNTKLKAIYFDIILKLTVHTEHCLMNSVFTIRFHETLFRIKLKLNSEADVALSLSEAH